MYMMAWQHQHFYGIRWIYFDDYNKAGFKMETNKRMASLSIIVQIILAGFFLNYSLKYCEWNVGFLLNAATTAALYAWGIKAALAFEKGLIDGKALKMQSYKHFTLVFAIVFANFAYRWYKGGGQPAKSTNRNLSGDECVSNYL